MAGTRRTERLVRQKEQPAQMFRGKKGPGWLEDQGKKAGVAEAEQLRMKTEAEREAGASRPWEVFGFAALRCWVRVFSGQRRHLIGKTAHEPGGRPTQPVLTLRPARPFPTSLTRAGPSGPLSV